MVSRRVFVAQILAGRYSQAADDEVAWASIETISQLLRRKKVSAADVTRLCLDRIEKHNTRLNAFVTVTAPSALEAARILDSEAAKGRWRGPLHGIPIALKDLYDTANVRTTAGSRHWANRIPSRDAVVVQRLKAAGAILLGKLNMDEFAYNFTGETSSFGTSRNPWNTGRSPGGSSGGSAVAVAAGMCFAALGSDTGGSIRLPAALCGVTGLKPTYGAASTEGVAPLAWSLDHVGPLCRTARDAALMLEAFSGKPVRDTTVDPRKLRLGVPRTPYYEEVDLEVEKVVSSATTQLTRLAVGARDVTLPLVPASRDLPDLPETYIRILTAEAYTFHQEMLRTRPDLYHPGTRKSIEGGAAVTAADYIRARQEMERLRSDSARVFADADY